MHYYYYCRSVKVHVQKEESHPHCRMRITADGRDRKKKKGKYQNQMNRCYYYHDYYDYHYYYFVAAVRFRRISERISSRPEAIGCRHWALSRKNFIDSTCRSPYLLVIIFTRIFNKHIVGFAADAGFYKPDSFSFFRFLFPLDAFFCETEWRGWKAR